MSSSSHSEGACKLIELLTPMRLYFHKPSRSSSSNNEAASDNLFQKVGGWGGVIMQTNVLVRILRSMSIGKNGPSIWPPLLALWPTQLQVSLAVSWEPRLRLPHSPTSPAKWAA